MTIPTPADRIEPAELTKLINSRKTAGMRKYNMERIERAVKNGGSLKAVKRRLGTRKNQMLAHKDKQGNVIPNRDKIVIVAEDFPRDLYSSLDIQDNTARESGSVEINIPPATTKVKKALKKMKGGKAPGEDQITAALLKDAGQNITEKTGKPVYAVPNDCECTGIWEEREHHTNPYERGHEWLEKLQADHLTVSRLQRTPQGNR